MSKKLKAIESEIQPNHKEAEIWVTPTNEDGSKEIRYWNRKKDEWSECRESESKGAELLIKWSDGSWAAIDVETMEIVETDGFDDAFPILELQRIGHGGERWHLKPNDTSNVFTTITRACLIQRLDEDGYYLWYNTVQDASYSAAEYLGGVTCDAQIVDNFAAIQIINSTKAITIDNVWYISDAPL